MGVRAHLCDGSLGHWALLTCNSVPPAITETLLGRHRGEKVPDAIVDFHYDLSNTMENLVLFLSVMIKQNFLNNLPWRSNT